jgi:hypothetical protein
MHPGLDHRGVSEKNSSMEKLQLTGPNLGQVFNFRAGCVHAMHLCSYIVKLPKLKLKIRPKQLLGLLKLDAVLPDGFYIHLGMKYHCKKCYITRHNTGVQ